MASVIVSRRRGSVQEGRKNGKDTARQPSAPALSRRLLATVKQRFGTVGANRHAKGFHNTPERSTDELPHGLLTMREAVAFAGVHPQTLRNWHRAGMLRVYVSPGGHRRFDRADLLRAMGRDTEEQGGGNRGRLIIGVVRVSTEKEEQATSLARQREEIEAFAQKEYGKGVDVWNERKASGLLFSHPKLLELIQGLTSGQWRGGVLIATYPDRILRQGRELIEHLARLGGVEVRYIMREEPKDFAEQISEDILAYMTAVCNRNSGMKAKKVLECQISEEGMKRAFELKRAGYADRFIARQLELEGFKDEKTGRPIHHAVISKRLRRSWSVLVKMYGKAEVKTNYDEFLQEKVRKTDTDSRLTFQTIWDCYEGWCQRRGEQAVSKRVVARKMKASWESGYNGNGIRVYRGVSLLRD